MNKPTRLTEAKIARLRCPERRKYVELPDSEIRGLLFRAYPSKRGWVLRYRVLGRQREWTLGTYPEIDIDEARDKARTLKRAAATGIDLKRAAISTETNPTTAELAEAFLRSSEMKVKSTNSQKSATYTLTSHIVPAIGGVRITEVRRGHVRMVVEPLLDAGKRAAAFQAHAQLRLLLRYAVDRDLIADNPAAAVKFAFGLKSRDRVLTIAELRSTWNAFQNPGSDVQVAVRFLVLTGCRLSEATKLTFADVTDDVITLRATKNGRDHLLPVVPELTALLHQQRLLRPFEERVFGVSPARIQAVVRRSQRGDCRWSCHDIRRTVATVLDDLELADRSGIAALLNHTGRGTTALHYLKGRRLKTKGDVLKAWHAWLHEQTIIGATSLVVLTTRIA